MHYGITVQLKNKIVSYFGVKSFNGFFLQYRNYSKNFDCFLPISDHFPNFDPWNELIMSQLSLIISMY